MSLPSYCIFEISSFLIELESTKRHIIFCLHFSTLSICKFKKKIIKNEKKIPLICIIFCHLCQFCNLINKSKEFCNLNIKNSVCKFQHCKWEKEKQFSWQSRGCSVWKHQFKDLKNWLTISTLTYWILNAVVCLWYIFSRGLSFPAPMSKNLVQLCPAVI